MSPGRLIAPWSPEGARAPCLPGSLILKLALGEAPERVPARNDVRDGAAETERTLDGGPVDRIVRTMAGGARIVRLHTAAANVGRTGRRNRDYTAHEQLSGVARTFLLTLDNGNAPLGDLSDALGSVTTVELASPNWLTTTPFEAPRAVAPRPGTEDGWASRRLVRAAEALAYEPGDPSVIVGVVDSGVAFGHPEFAGRLRSGYDTVQLGEDSVAPGVLLLGDRHAPDRDPLDEFVGHGMGCAGIIGAIGQAMPPGLAGNTQLLPMRALGAAQLPGKAGAVGMGAISDLDVAVKLAADLGAKVINLSFGTDDGLLSPGLPRPHADVVAYAADRGCILVAASGNNGQETVYWPAAFPQVIAVGSAGLDRRPSRFSTTGEHVALCAPGERVLTAALTGLQEATGTSFAAPFVSAVAALMVSRAARRARPMDGATVRELLVRSVQPFAQGAHGSGAGILDALAALRAVDSFIDEEDDGP